MTALDLSRPRDLGEILREALRLFGAHGSVFLTLTIVIVAPIGLLVDGVWGRALAEGPDAHPPAAVTLVTLMLSGFVLPALVTALNVSVVMGLARGEEPAVGTAFRRALPVVARALGAVALAAAGVALGTVALILPGIWLAIRWYVAAQVAVVEGLSGRQALQRSAQLVGDRWGNVLGLVLVTGLGFGLAGALLPALVGGASAPLYVAAMIVGQSIALSLTAIAGTLLYFDLRARRGEPWAPGGP
ncbi:MAG: hypothetical protein JWQ20_2211 [Conexibacter sp.]|nr:hypothetical protein [Conexibacter sp.]